MKERREGAVTSPPAEGRGEGKLFWNFSPEKSGKSYFFGKERNTLHYSRPLSRGSKGSFYSPGGEKKNVKKEHKKTFDRIP